MRWFLYSFGLILLILCATCWPLLTNPQLEPDDYRYLHLVQRLDEEFAGRFLQASVVENRWDHLWWIAAENTVRFFRPTVVASYWLDTRIYGDQVVTGLLVTNLLIFLLCALLVARILLRLVGPGLPALAGSALFAAFLCHNEVLWYIAGRTDSLAALGFLAGFALHISGRRWLALPCYALAFLTKELTVALPAVCLLHDWLIEGKGKRLLLKEWKLYATYGIVALAIQAGRSLALPEGGSSLVYPYFISPLSASFPAHLVTQLRNYSENLLIGTRSKPFLTPQELDGYSSTAGLCLVIAALALLISVLRKDRRFLFFCALGVLTWLPTSFVYVSGRYLLLPSVAVAAFLALFLDRLKNSKTLFYSGLVLACAWTLHQGYGLERIHDDYSNPGGMQVLEGQVRALETPFPGKGKVLILNLWGNWLQAQFLEDALRVIAQDPDLWVRILTPMPVSEGMGGGIRLRREGEKTLLVEGNPVLDSRGLDSFPWRELKTGARFENDRLGFAVEIVDGDGSRCRAVRFRFDEPLESYTIYRFVPHPDRRLPAYVRMRRGVLEQVSVP